MTIPLVSSSKYDSRYLLQLAGLCHHVRILHYLARGWWTRSVLP